MNKPQEKAKGRVKQAVGQIVGNDNLVLEGKKQERKADRETQKGDQPKQEIEVAPAPNSEASEQTSEPTGRKGPVLD